MLRSLLSVSLLCGAISPALASGQLDPSFDQDGVLTHALSSLTGLDGLRAGLIDASGRYVGVGTAPARDGLGGAVLRILASGQRDPSFGVNGLVQLPLVAPFSNIVWRDVEEQPDGKLVVAGRADYGTSIADPGLAYLCRLLENGTPDPDFGDGGCAQPVFAVGSNVDNLVAIALQPDGRIVLTGETDGPEFSAEYVVGRLDSDGSYDLCFGDATCTSGGLLIEPEPDDDGIDFFGFRTADIALAPDGRIVVAGRTRGALEDDMAVIQLLSNGNVDVGGFGNGGHRRVAFDQGGTNFDSATSMLVRDDGSIVLVGTVDTAFGILGGIAALDMFGAPINGFGTNGRTLFFYNDVSPEHSVRKVIQQEDGKLLVVGYTDDTLNMGDQFADCGVARFLSNGQPDPVFGFGGVNGFDGSLGVPPLQPDGCFGIDTVGDRIVLFGQRFNGNMTGHDALFMRLDQDDLFANGFEN